MALVATPPLYRQTTASMGGSAAVNSHRTDQRRVKIGAVGVGDVARKTYLPGIVALDNVELVAVCDNFPGRAEAAMGMYGAREYYTGYEEMLAKADIEAVVVLTSMPFHAPVAIAALQAGKHAYTEKPLATRLEDAEKMIEEAGSRQLKLACAPPLMLTALNQKMKELIAQGVIGKVCFAQAHGSHRGPERFGDRYTDPTWFYKPGAGPVFDLAVYQLHILTGILGPAKTVTALSGISIPERTIYSGPTKGQKIDVEVDDNTQIMLDFGDATFAYVDATFCMLASQGARMQFFGSEGTLAVVGAGGLQVYRQDGEAGIGGWMGLDRSYFQAPASWSLAQGVEHLADCILEDRQPVISAEHARHVLEIMLKAGEAAREGRTRALETTFSSAG
jgi:predicted dehydrogenase